MYKKMFASLLIIAVVLPFALGTDVDSCKEGGSKPIYVDIKNCEKQPCELKRGTNVEMIMNFTAIEYTTQLKAKVVALVDDLPVPFPLPQPNACEELINTHCPLEENEPAFYKLVMPIRRIYPPIGLRLIFSVQHNGGKENLVCFEVECIVV